MSAETTPDIKFTDLGSVRVKLDSSSVKQPCQVQLVLTVEDTGIGIPKALSKEVFKPFLQADSADSRRGGRDRPRSCRDPGARGFDGRLHPARKARLPR